MFYEKTVLDNGITVITESMEGVRSVALGFWVRVGGRDEAPAEYGMSHFMEHMLFKGTKTRSALDISTAFDALGAEFNAFTSREYTCFYTRLIDERLKLGFEILADMLVNSTFAHKDIVTEREVVLEEIARSQDTPEDYVYDVFSKAMFPQDALGCPVLGTPDTVSSFDTEEMLRYHQAHYTTGNVTVVACGSVDHESIVEMAVRCLGGLVTGPRLERDAVQPQDRVMLSCVKKDSEQANIVFGAPTIVNNDPRRFVYSLLDIIIGGGMSSRLFQEIREKRGLVYSVYASSQLYEGAGIFEMYAGTRPENIAEVVKVATEQFALAAQDGVSEEELARAKELAAGSFVLGTESTRTRMSRLGRLAALDLPMDSIDDIIEKMNPNKSVIIKSSEAFDFNQRKETEYFIDYVTPAHTKTSLDTNFRWDLENREFCIGSLDLFRSEKDLDFTEREMEICRIFQPHIELKASNYAFLFGNIAHKYAFTSTEQDVAVMMLKGYSNEQIAEEKCITISTVKKHVSKILEKSDTKSRIEFVCKASSGNR